MKIGLIGLTHDHIWGHIEPLKNHSDVEIVAAADPNQPLLDKVSEQTGCKTYTDYKELLSTESLDAAYVFADNKGGAEMATAALNAGLHVMIEKPMGADYAGAKAMYDAAKSNDKRLMINWPTMWWPQLQHAIQIAKDGAIGDLWQVRYRAAHSGPKNEGCSDYFCGWLYDKVQNGAGAFMDYCCYGSILSRVMLGKPNAVTGISAQIDPSLAVEDNGVLIMHYDKAMSVAEASWTQIGKITAYTTTFYGSGGLLLMDHHREDKLILATKENGGGEAVDIPEPAEHMQNATNHFVHGIQTGEAFHDLLAADTNIEAQEALNKGLESAEAGKQLPL